jgi:hypothetical protein
LGLIDLFGFLSVFIGLAVLTATGALVALRLPAPAG